MCSSFDFPGDLPYAIRILEVRLPLVALFVILHQFSVLIWEFGFYYELECLSRYEF